MEEFKDDFKISQLTKELVTARLKQMEDPCAAAAALVKDALSVALKGLPPGAVAESRVVEDACQGAMTGLLLNDQPLHRGAVLILERVVDLANALNLDQTELMRSALRGIADMRRFVRIEVLGDMRQAIEARFHGAGLAFEALCAEPTPDPSPEKKGV
jgi:hypothetical protein